MPFVVNSVSLFVSLLVIFLFYFKLITISDDILFYAGIIITFLLWYNAALYADIKYLTGKLNEKFIDRTTLTILTGIYMSTIGVMIASHDDFKIEQYNYTEAVLILWSSLFVYGVMTLLFFGILGVRVIRASFRSFSRYFDK